MARPFRFRPSRREIIAANNAANAFYAGASENPKAQENLAKLLVPEPPQRHRVKRPVDGKPAVPLESDVIRAIGELLAVHPKVLWACRQNSGAASYEASSGRYQPIFFYRILTGQDMTVTDFWGLLRPVGDAPARVFAFEAKRSSFTSPKTGRELRQWAFLTMILNCGGVAGFVRSAEEANELLNG